MAGPKKNQLFQVLFPMVDRTDFATIESTVVAASVVGKFYGANHGGSAAMTSGTLSKAISLVRSGIFRATVKATEANYDFLLLRFTNSSCADQLLQYNMEEADTSDILSALTVIQSMASDAHSAAAQANSRILLVQSLASDAHSAATQVNSRVLVAQSYLSDIRSHVSDLQSDFQSRVPKAVATLSKLSDVESNLLSLLGTTGVQLNASSLSDLRSAITAVTASVSASDMSDIASRVEVLLASRLSDILSAAQQTNSRVLVVQSLTSDIYSLASNINSVATSSPTASDIASKVWADTAGAAASSRVLLILSRVSDVQSAIAAGVPLDASTLSDIRSAITAGGGGGGGTVTASDISDIASAVRAILVSDLSDILSAAQQINSRVLVAQSYLSDVRSQITAGVPLDASTMSDLRSAVAGVTASVSASDMSDIASRVDVLLASRLSDILSATQQTNSRVLVVQSLTSDLQSKLSDVESNLLSLLTTTGVQLNASSLSDIRSAITAGATGLDASALSDIASAVVAAIGAAGVELGASSMSDIRSALLIIQSMASDAHSAATAASSRALLNQSRISDVQSALAAGVSLDASTMSDLRSAIAATELDASDLSDIASAVRTVVSSDLSDAISALAVANSRILVNQSVASDIYSRVLAGVPLDASTMSDLRSAISEGGITASAISDIASAVWATPGVEPTTVVSPTGTMKAKVDWLTALSRNKITQTGSVQSLRNDADSADIASAAVSDDGTTFTRGEFS